MAEPLRVRVRFASVYLGPNLRALPQSDVGAIITIAGGSYAEGLIAQGFVENTTIIVPVELPEPLDPPMRYGPIPDERFVPVTVPAPALVSPVAAARQREKPKTTEENTRS